MEIQNIVNYIIIVLLGGIIIAILSCRRPNSNKEENRSSEIRENKDLTTMIRSFFDSQEWKYRQYSEEDFIESFMLRFTGLNEEILLRVDVIPNHNMYLIIGQSKTIVPVSNIEGAIKAINRYNLRAKVVSGCIGEDGTITFWMGRNTDGETFSEGAFGCDFDMVMREVDKATAHILKEALATVEVGRRNSRPTDQ